MLDFLHAVPVAYLCWTLVLVAGYLLDLLVSENPVASNAGFQACGPCGMFMLDPGPCGGYPLDQWDTVPVTYIVSDVLQAASMVCWGALCPAYPVCLLMSYDLGA